MIQWSIALGNWVIRLGAPTRHETVHVIDSLSSSRHSHELSDPSMPDDIRKVDGEHGEPVNV